jgi:hypothetical protein
MNIKNKSEELYLELVQEYKSPHFPTKEEKKEAIVYLNKALLKEVDPEIMKSKIRMLSITHGEFKGKITNLIINQFWDQDLGFGNKARKYKREF